MNASRYRLDVAHQIEIGGDDAAQIFAKREVDRRAVIECANAHAEDVLGAAGGFVGETIHEVGMQLTLVQHSGAAGGDAKQIGHAVLL